MNAVSFHTEYFIHPLLGEGRRVDWLGLVATAAHWTLRRGFTTLLTTSSKVPALPQHLSFRQYCLELPWLVVRLKLEQKSKLDAEEESTLLLHNACGG